MEYPQHMLYQYLMVVTSATCIYHGNIGWAFLHERVSEKTAYLTIILYVCVYVSEHAHYENDGYYLLFWDISAFN